MRLKTESGNVVSSHSSAWGASSLTAKLVIDSRSCSCSSLKMKCLRLALKSGFRTLSAVAAMSGSPFRLAGLMLAASEPPPAAAPARGPLGANYPGPRKKEKRKVRTSHGGGDRVG